MKLHTIIYSPKNATGNLPVLLTRTPYGIASAGGSFATSYAELAEEGFIFAFQDIRGRFNRPVARRAITTCPALRIPAGV